MGVRRVVEMVELVEMGVRGVVELVEMGELGSRGIPSRRSETFGRDTGT